MQDIISYFNYFLEVVFGSYGGGPAIQLFRPYRVIQLLQQIFFDSRSGDLWTFISSFFQDYNSFSIILSLFVWFWFGWFSVHLLLIWPFNWFRSIIRKCKG